MELDDRLAKAKAERERIEARENAIQRGVMAGEAIVARYCASLDAAGERGQRVDTVAVGERSREQTARSGLLRRGARVVHTWGPEKLDIGPAWWVLPWRQALASTAGLVVPDLRHDALHRDDGGGVGAHAVHGTSVDHGTVEHGTQRVPVPPGGWVGIVWHEARGLGAGWLPDGGAWPNPQSPLCLVPLAKPGPGLRASEEHGTGEQVAVEVLLDLDSVPNVGDPYPGIDRKYDAAGVNQVVDARLRAVVERLQARLQSLGVPWLL